MMVYATLLMQAENYMPRLWDSCRIFIQWLIPVIPFIAFYILLAFCIYRAAKYFGTAGKEQKLIRMEMGKLAEEVRQLRQKLESGEK